MHVTSCCVRPELWLMPASPLHTWPSESSIRTSADAFADMPGSLEGAPAVAIHAMVVPNRINAHCRSFMLTNDVVNALPSFAIP